MVASLLPATAAGPTRNPPVVVLKTVMKWLFDDIHHARVLQQVLGKKRRPSTNLKIFEQDLSNVLGSPKAEWSLCDLATQPLFGSASCSEPMLHISGYVVSVDYVYEDKVVFKLTRPSVESLIRAYNETFTDPPATNIGDRSQEQAYINDLRSKFAKDVNELYFHTDIEVLRGIQEDGSGELVGGRSKVLKAQISALVEPSLLFFNSFASDINMSVDSPMHPLQFAPEYSHQDLTMGLLGLSRLGLDPTAMYSTNVMNRSNFAHMSSPPGVGSASCPPQFDTDMGSYSSSIASGTFPSSPAPPLSVSPLQSRVNTDFNLGHDDCAFGYSPFIDSGRSDLPLHESYHQSFMYLPSGTTWYPPAC